MLALELPLSGSFPFDLKSLRKRSCCHWLESLWE